MEVVFYKNLPRPTFGLKNRGNISASKFFFLLFFPSNFKLPGIATEVCQGISSCCSGMLPYAGLAVCSGMLSCAGLPCAVGCCRVQVCSVRWDVAVCRSAVCVGMLPCAVGRCRVQVCRVRWDVAVCRSAVCGGTLPCVGLQCAVGRCRVQVCSVVDPSTVCLILASLSSFKTVRTYFFKVTKSFLQSHKNLSSKSLKPFFKVTKTFQVTLLFVSVPLTIDAGADGVCVCVWCVWCVVCVCVCVRVCVCVCVYVCVWCVCVCVCVCVCAVSYTHLRAHET